MDGRNSSGRGNNAVSMEANAIMEAVELAIYCKWSNVIIESDAQILINSLQRSEDARSGHHNTS